MSLSFLIFFGLAFVLVFALRLARIGTLLAFLLAGVISGPYVLGLFQLSEIWNSLGEIGIIFLWFTMGLELNMKRLWQMRRNIFGFGAAQVLMVVAMVFPILFGLTSWSIMGTVMVALLLSMSSTSNDLQILAERDELQSQMGRQTFSILLFQDLLSIPILAMLPIFAGRSINMGAEVIDVVVLSVGLIISVMLAGRFILTPLMRSVSKLKSREVFLLTIMLIIIMCVVSMQYFGLPPALGAFLAGMIMSETIYRHQVRAEISPYTILFLSFFFIALGMGLDLQLLINNWWIVIGGAIALIIIKFIAIYIVARVRSVRANDAFMIALILAQGGEFALLILKTMKTNDIQAIPFVHSEILTGVIILSIMATPILISIYDKLRKSGKLFNQHVAKKINSKNQNSVKPEVVICGFGRVGQTVAQMLQKEKIPYVAIDLNVDSVMIGNEMGFNVFYGDTSSSVVLTELGLNPRKTRAVVIALDNSAMAKRTVRAVHQIAPKVKIFARARNMEESKVLLNAGAKEALPETIESAFLLGRGVLANAGIPEKEIETTLHNMRKNQYANINKLVDNK